MESRPGKEALRTVWFLLGGLLFFLYGLHLRLDSPGHRPMHADEATGARILADRLESGSYQFDPTHFHGPLLTAMAAPIARLRGETDWRSLTPETLRAGIAVAGALCILAALGFAPWTGRAGALAAAAWVATSPFLVYYSRVFIHETLFGLLVLVTLLALFHHLRRPSWRTALVFGLAAGLLMSTRETFVLCFFSWAVAASWFLFRLHRQGDLGRPHPVVRRWARDGLVAGAAASLVVAALHTDFGRQPSGLTGFFSTFFLYETGGGHEKPFPYYALLLLWPKHQGGVWWTEAGIGVAAVAGFGLSFRHGKGAWIRFLFFAAAIQWLIYSISPYKTPWLMLATWLHLCLVAGAGIGFLLRPPGEIRAGAVMAIVLSLLWWQNLQAGRAAHRYASDPRNPYAYVPTSGDVGRAGVFLKELTAFFPENETGPVAVIGTGYWPLPWYLREIPQTGYWPVLPEEAASFPVLIVLPRELPAARERLRETHTAIPRGLRADTPMVIFIRNDIWEAFLDDEP